MIISNRIINVRKTLNLRNVISYLEPYRCLKIIGVR